MGGIDKTLTAHCYVPKRRLEIAAFLFALLQNSIHMGYHMGYHMGVHMEIENI